MRKTTAYARAVIRSRIEADIQRLRTDTGLQAYMGDDAARVANMAGRHGGGSEHCGRTRHDR